MSRAMVSVVKLEGLVSFMQKRQEGEREYRALGLAGERETASVWRERTLEEVKLLLEAIINETNETAAGESLH